MEWQPIETAPKDGRLILMITKNASDICGVYVAYWNDEMDWFQFHKEGYVTNPTHWMPIPALPTKP